MLILLIDLTIIITLLVIAFRASKAIRNSKTIFSEYSQSTILALLVFIYPFGPLLLLVGSPFISKPYLFPLVIACFIPQLILGRRQNRVFELSGTDRTHSAKEALSTVNLGALIGLIYVSIYFILHVSVINLNFSYYGA